MRYQFNSTVFADLNITAANSVVQHVAFIVEPKESRETIVTQKLTTTGIWTIQVIVRTPGAPATDSYSFEVKTNQDDASLAVSELRDSQFHTDLEIGTLIVAALALAMSLFSLHKQRVSTSNRRKKRNR